MMKTVVQVRKTGNLQRSNTMSGWLIMLPSLILFAFFVWEPLLESIRLSLYTAQGLRLQEFVGLDNYAALLKQPDFWPAIRNTFFYTIASLVIGFFIPIILASLISETTRFKGLFRVGVYFPNIVPGIAMALMWGYFFRPGNTGVLNILLGKVGLASSTWLSNSHWTIPLIIITMTWKSAGATALIYMAGINGINPELYEAATIDGATVWQRYFRITLPNIYNLARMLLVLQIISVFQILYEPLIMTNGGPNNASISIMQLVFRFAFEKMNYPMAAALSVVISLILIVLTVVYFKAVRRKDA